jgi:integrase
LDQRDDSHLPPTLGNGVCSQGGRLVPIRTDVTTSRMASMVSWGLLSLPLIDRVPMALLLDAGLRKKEGRQQQVRRLKLDTREVIVIGGKGDKDRVVPMTGRLAGMVEELLFLERLDAQDYIWYSRPGGGHVQPAKMMGDTSFTRWWKKSLDAAGVRYRNPHTTRHKFATRWLRRAGDWKRSRSSWGTSRSARRSSTTATSTPATCWRTWR